MSTPATQGRARGPERDPAAGPAAARARREPGLNARSPLLTSSPYLRSMALLDNMDLQQLMAGGDLNQEEAARRAQGLANGGPQRSPEDALELSRPSQLERATRRRASTTPWRRRPKIRTRCGGSRRMISSPQQQRQ